MRKKRVQKKSGGTRQIYVPSTEEKAALGALLPELNETMDRVCSDAVHGFFPGRSSVTNALAHVGRQHSLSVDVADFFDSVNATQLRRHLKKSTLVVVLVDGAPRQGLPTSPAVANIAMAETDAHIEKMLERRSEKLGISRVAYTRYADDLTVSWDGPEAAWKEIRGLLYQALGRSGFRANRSKTRLQSSRRGHRVVCGVTITSDGIRPTRALRRKLRAAEFQARGKRAPARLRGLREWAKLRPPSTPASREERNRLSSQKLAARLGKAWNLGIDPGRKIPEGAIPDISSGNFVVTRDPAYVLGLSTWTTSWSVCTTQPSPRRPEGGEYRCGVVRWLYCRGASVAAVLSPKMMTLHGVRRRKIRARCLVYRLRDHDVVVYDRLYGDSDRSRRELRRACKAAGFVSMKTAVERWPLAAITGMARDSWGGVITWLDNVKWRRKASTGKYGFRLPDRGTDITTEG